jgi:hypothetical protein
MWRIVLGIAVSMFIAKGAHAQLRVPSGCFVTDAERELYVPRPNCFNEERAPYIPYTMDNGYSAEDINLIYGFQFGFSVNAAHTLFYSWQDAESRAAANKQSADIHYGWYVTEFNKTKQLKALESRLRKTCGSKCRKIKTIKTVDNAGDGSMARQSLPSSPGNPSSSTFAQFLQQRK